jgi:hypothetical protein
MSKHEFPYSYPLSTEDLVEIRMKASRERNEALVQLVRSASAALARLVPKLSREPAHPATPCTTSAR